MRRGRSMDAICCRSGAGISSARGCARRPSMPAGLLGPCGLVTRSCRPTRSAPPPVPESGERRQNVALRELLDEMIQLSRHLSNHAPALGAAELRYARERMEWL